MGLKVFTNHYNGNATKSIAINSAHVISVFETEVRDEETDKNIKVTNIFCLAGTTFQVRDSYLDVISTLNDD